MNKHNFLLISIYITVLTVLSIYSYSQIDLNLTLSSNSFYQSVQQKLIQLGYFNRSLSTGIYIFLLLILFGLQLSFYRESVKGNISSRQVLYLGAISSLILLFSYPAFSHDIFNYIFDARMVIFHKVNPFTHTALDFPLDLWTRFMRWTHRTYPYGPFWLILTIPFYLLGLGKFTLTLFWFKLIGVISYLSSLWFIKKIINRTSPKYVTSALVLFAFNPLVLIESLVSVHLDITMTVFFLMALYFMVAKKKKALSIIMLIISVGIKFATASAIPVFMWWKGNEERFEKAVFWMLLLILATLAYVIYIKEILPWYFLVPISLVALLPSKRELIKINFGLSLGLLLRYVPFLFKGEYTQWVKSTRDLLTIIPLGLSLAWILWKKRQNFLF